MPPKPENLTEEDKKILKEAHENKDNPNHPANKDHPEHHEFMHKLGKRFGNAAMFGAGATFGSRLMNDFLKQCGL